MTKHSENNESSNSTKPVLAVVIDKTIGGFDIKDFKKLEKPIDRNILEPHIYEGTIKGILVETSGKIVKTDFYCTWDKFGRCANFNRKDCFIDVSGL